MSIDAGFVPRARTDLAFVVVDGEAVVYDRASDCLHRLNPSATLVWECCDGTGTVAEVGADLALALGLAPDEALREVSAAVEQLLALDLLDRSDSPPPAGEPSATPRAGDPSAPTLDPEAPPRSSPCRDPDFPGVVWSHELPVEVGGTTMLLQTNDPDVGLALADLAGVLATPVPGDASGATVTYGIWLPPPAPAGLPQRRITLYRDGCPIARVRTPLDALRRLVAHLGAHLPIEAPLLAVRAYVVVSGDQAVVGPASLATIHGLDRHLARLGVTVLPDPVARIDPHTRELVTATPLGISDAAIVRALGIEDEPSEPLADRYRLVGWARAAGARDEGVEASTVYALAHEIVNFEADDAQAVLERITHVVAPVAPRALVETSPKALAIELLGYFPG